MYIEKLPSGKWRALADYKDKVGRRHRKSVTADTKRAAEYAALAWLQEQEMNQDVRRITLGQAADEYIDLKRPILSPSTIEGYCKIRRNAFPGLWDIPLAKIDADILTRAVLDEMDRPPAGRSGRMSAKSVRNNYGFVSSVLKRFMPGRVFHVDLPRSPRRIRSLPSPDVIYSAVRGTDIELPVLLAMWLSFTESEIRGLSKSKSIDGEYITIRSVVIHGEYGFEEKAIGKTSTRNRRHHMPPRIRELIDRVEGDVICPMIPSVLLRRFYACLDAAGIPRITFHDLRHINASVMAMLRIPDKYAMERGGWSSDYIMKQVYTETFSPERQAVDKKIDDYFSAFVSGDSV